MLIDELRKVIPQDIRVKAGVWLVNQVGRSNLLLQPYIRILYGKIPEGLKLEKGLCTFTYRNTKIIAPRNSACIYLEIFKDEVYEMYYKPKKGDTVLDIGAYVGMFSVKMAKEVGPGGKVIAVEPKPNTFSTLKLNTRDLTNITLINKAIWSKNGTMRLYCSRAPGSDTLIKHKNSESIEVEVITLDRLVEDFKLPRVDFIKMDAEGAELEVLRGAPNLLKQAGLKLAVASYHKSQEGESLIPKVEEFFQSENFKVKIDKGLRGYIYAEKIS